MRNGKVLSLVLLLVIPFGVIACDLISPQEPIEMPKIKESQIGKASCEICVRGIANRVVDNPVVKRIVFERPVMQKIVEKTRERPARRKPVRSLISRLLRR
tara:strand:+ start:3699 stop:4001 length:303 start_codon:yes stop_codon:yes gene_type:complete